MPSEVFLSFKNWNFFTITKNSLFLIDFSNDDPLNNLSIQLSQFPKTKWVFYYVAQVRSFGFFSSWSKNILQELSNC